jgi:hypothetical protein
MFEKQPKFDLFHNISIYFIILDESVDIIENVNSIDCFINFIFEKHPIDTLHGILVHFL